MDTRNTKQKRLIYEVLEKSRNHPTIQELYLEVLKLDPKVGQATVYRNINRLVEEKKVMRVFVSSGIIRYDARVFPHYHFLCHTCGRVFDLCDNDYGRVEKDIEERYHVKVLSSMISFSGICFQCLEKK